MRRNLLLRLTMIMPLSWAVIMMNAEAVEHVVGDDRGWAPHSDFHGWASRHLFHVGDNLWFAYASGEHSVIELNSKEEWDACDISNPIRVYNGGLDSVALVHVGTRYFTCRRVEDCQSGMKLHINVDAAPSSSESRTLSESYDGILGNLISRQNLQKIGEWFLPWPAIEDFAEAPISESPPPPPPLPLPLPPPPTSSEPPPTFSTRSIFSSIPLSFLLLFLY